MAREFPENAHLNTDRKKYGDSYDHIFNRKECKCELCEDEKAKSQHLPDSPVRVVCEPFGPCDL